MHPKPSPWGWRSAQRIEIFMIASGNHSLIPWCSAQRIEIFMIAPQGHFFASLRAPVAIIPQFLGATRSENLPPTGEGGTAKAVTDEGHRTNGR